MLIQELYDYYGSWSQMSRELGLGVNTYRAWLTKGYIPYPSQLVIEKKTKKRFKADELHGRTTKKV